ncbi:Hsp33 family molecular chaperone HslO [Emcibacter sp.]|uniref:Hsp33 family molecular chaperone HslO n=1 Tax=Emcibacter sp. TaxID=1979954 RepID=UPI002AA66F28|nr:Hsp33 family molecular chaperone HslO [Emcibacter sp.]
MTIPDAVLTDACLPFSLEGRDIRGRIVRLDETINKVLNTHKLPEEISRELGEIMVLAALLGSMLKYEGILTVQIRGDRGVNFIVADFATAGEGSGVIRGYAQYDPEKWKAPEEPSLATLMGDKGHMLITIDQGKFMDRYQGIVALEGETLSEAAVEYFHNSEQLPSRVRIVCTRDGNGRWKGAAIMLQHLARNTDLERLRNRDGSPEAEDWQNACVLMDSVTDKELLDTSLPLQDLLFRLFHEGGVRVFDPVQMANGCRCSEDKLRQVLSNFSPDDLQHMAEDGVITMTCEFCKTDHVFELKKLFN